MLKITLSSMLAYIDFLSPVFHAQFTCVMTQFRTLLTFFLWLITLRLTAANCLKSKERQKWKIEEYDGWLIDWAVFYVPWKHSIGYMGDGFYRSKDPTNSIKVLKEEAVKEKKQKKDKENTNYI